MAESASLESEVIENSHETGKEIKYSQNENIADDEHRNS